MDGQTPDDLTLYIPVLQQILNENHKNMCGPDIPETYKENRFVVDVLKIKEHTNEDFHQLEFWIE